MVLVLIVINAILSSSSNTMCLLSNTFW